MLQLLIPPNHDHSAFGAANLVLQMQVKEGKQSTKRKAEEPENEVTFSKKQR